ncbi:MAG: hypothetical protein QOJ97_1951 [Solirubrobacteraceae bacterium]|nr:hypothetical protein [Solirubrobacteraceae bacterium]
MPVDPVVLTAILATITPLFDYCTLLAALAWGSVRTLARDRHLRKTEHAIGGGLDDFEGGEEFIVLGLRLVTCDVTAPREPYVDSGYVVVPVDPAEAPAGAAARVVMQYVSAALMPEVLRHVDARTRAAVRLTFAKGVVTGPSGSAAVRRAFYAHHYDPARDADPELAERLRGMDWLVAEELFLPVLLGEYQRVGRELGDTSPSPAYVAETAAFAEWLARFALVKPGDSWKPGFVHRGTFFRVALVFVEAQISFGRYRDALRAYLASPDFDVAYLTARADQAERAALLYGRFNDRRYVDIDQSRCEVPCSPRGLTARIGSSPRSPSRFVGRLVPVRDARPTRDAKDSSRHPWFNMFRPNGDDKGPHPFTARVHRREYARPTRY